VHSKRVSRDDCGPEASQTGGAYGCLPHFRGQWPALRKHPFEKWKAGGGGSPIPNLAPLPLEGDAGWIADLDRDAARAGSIGSIDLLRDDAFRRQAASVSEDDRAILGDVFIDQMRVVAIPDEVERIEYRGLNALPTGQLLEL
jgi:hypothetical protein